MPLENKLETWLIMIIINLQKRTKIMKRVCYLFVVFWIIFLSFGQFYIVQSQTSCNDGESHLFQTYQNGNVGFIDKTGNFVIPAKFDNTFSYFIGDITAASANKLWGFIDKKGSWVIEPKYQRVIDITDHLLIVIDNGKYQVLDRNSKSVIASFDEIYDFQGKLAPVRVSNKWGFINLYGNLVINPQFDDAGIFSEGLAHVKKGDKNLYINESGQAVVELNPDIEVGGIFKGGLALIQVKNRYGFINQKGEIVIKPKFREVSYEFAEGFARFCENDRCGFINQIGEKIIPAKYDYVEQFTEGLAHVMVNEKHGFINQKGEVVIPLKYDNAGTFECGISYVEFNGKWAYIGKNGKFIFSPRSLK
jgi:hypothetical protein